MRSHWAAFAALAALLVVACATTEPAVGKLPDRSCDGDCDVDVDPSMGTVPDKVVVRNGRGKKIRWIIRPNQGSFAQNGIEFDPPGRQVFTSCTRSPNMRMFTCENSGAIGGPNDYKYTVRLQGRPAVDPFVVNQ